MAGTDAYAADDFEEAIGWVLWTLGFASATFGTNPKTSEAFDTIAVSPAGDFLVVECTTGLLRADGKLSKLVARAASLRNVLDASNMRQIRVLPVIVTAMTRDEVKADQQQAKETGVLVLTKENLEMAFDALSHFPDANYWFERAWQSLKPDPLSFLSEK